jgi:hypothetical protein
VFYAGSFNTHYVYPFKLKSFPTALLSLQDLTWQAMGQPRHPQREEGTSILLPLLPPDYRPRVLLVGGGTFKGKTITAQAELIDLGDSQPAWVDLASQPAHPRYPYSVLLPTRQILVVGGRRGPGDHAHPPTTHVHPPQSTGEPAQDPDAIHQAELYDPDAGTWRVMASMRRDRLYHGNAMLLPDGRVMAAGSNPQRGGNELTIETYKPPYLFAGDRPSIESAPARIAYGERFEIGTPQDRHISEAALMRPSATTHCVDAEQRYVGLQVGDTGPTRLVAEAPPDPFVAPPGIYMLFIVRDGVPSRAAFLRLG